MKSMSQLGTSALFMFWYLLSSSAGQRHVRDPPLIRHVPCSNRMTGESGICTFNWSCLNVAHGVHIGHCVDRFFIGTCCKIPKENAGKETNNSSFNGVAEPSKKDGEMDSPTSLIHILAIKKQETELVSINDAIHSSTTFNPLNSTTSDEQPSFEPTVTLNLDSVVNKGYWDYSIISNHNRKPILPVTPYHSYFSHTTKQTSTLDDTPQRYFPGSNSDQITEILTHQNEVAVSQTSSESKTYINNTHDFRKPVSTHPTHNHRVPVIQTINVDSTHNQRKPVGVHETFDQRKPVTSEATHHNRKPVSLEKDHTQHWPVLNEESSPSHFNSTQSTIITNFENNSISDDHHLLMNESKLFVNSELTTELSNKKTLTEAIYFTSEKEPSNDLYSVSSTSLPVINDSKINESEKSNTKSFNTQTTSSFPFGLFTIQPSIPSKNTPSFNISKVCGRPRSTTTARIVGGRKSQHLRWPWMISLRIFEGKTFKHKCGATLLNQFWAATAAHCVDGKLPQDMVLRLGEYNFQRSDNWYPYVERRVYVMVIHPDFNPSTFESDLALLRFEDPVQYQANIVPVCLPSIMDDITGRIAVVTGWGKLAEEGEFPSMLHEVYVPILSNMDCEKMYYEAGYTEAIKNRFVCAGIARGGLDACEGDSGGPMVVKGERGQWVLVGLISWGISCAAPKQPGVYTRISEFRDWILEIIDH